jgi:uncharacterized membrane protein
MPLKNDKRTIRIGEELEIAAPAEQVWSVLGNYPQDPQWRQGVRSMTLAPQGAPAPGSQTVEVLEFAGKTYRNVGVLQMVAPNRIEWKTIEGARAQGSRMVRPAGLGRCVARLELTVIPSGIESLLAPLLGWMLRRNIRQDLARLAQLATAPSV